MRLSSFSRSALALTLFAWAAAIPARSRAAVALPGMGVVQKVERANDELTIESVAIKRAALQKELTATRNELTKLPEGMSEDSARWLTQETALLERIDAVHADQQRTLQHGVDLAKESAEIEERTRNGRPPEATLKPPYDLAQLDACYAERDYLELAVGVLKQDVAHAETALQQARDVQSDKDRNRRSVRSGIAGSGGDGNLRIAELETRLARETLLLRERALRTLRLQFSLVEPKRKILLPQVTWLRDHFQIGTEDANSTPQQAKASATLDDAIAAAKKDADAVTAGVIGIERRGTAEKQPEEMEARRADRQTANLTLSVLTAQRERLARANEVSTLRRRVLSKSMSGSDLRALARANRVELNAMDVERSNQVTDLLKSRAELQDWQRRITRAAAADETRTPWSVARIKRLSSWIELSEIELAQLDQRRTERNRLNEEIGLQVNLFSFRDASARLRTGAIALWNYEVFSVKDEPVRVKTILTVLLLLVAGYYASHRISETLSRTVLKRFGMNTGRRAAAQSLWFYLLFSAVVMTAFNLFHISLTQFSVVSGALAVGIGFGSQTLIGNFISGIILLIERPVSQGDVIEIDGRQVTVERVGARSTVVRSADNTHVIVPNSRLLDRPVTNWTMSDDVVRKRVRVGVAYGSPARKVAELLKGILAETESVRKEPAPLVKFSDFGENALMFDLYFWATISDPLDAENEIRHRIAEVLAAEEIATAPTKPMPAAGRGGSMPSAPTDGIGSAQD